MKKSLTFALLGLLLFAGCDDEGFSGPTGALELQFLAKYQGQPFLIAQPLDYATGKKIMFSGYSFFITDVRLLPADGSDPVDLTEVEFVDFSGNGTVEDATTPQRFSYASVPTGDYRGIELAIGVNAELNNKTWTDYPPDHPLHRSSHYWSDWQSFMFTKLDGIYDANDDGMFLNNNTDHALSIHTGSNQLYTPLTILTDFKVVENQSNSLPLSVDVYRLFDNGTDVLDLDSQQLIHTNDINDLTIASFVMGNYQVALKAD